MHLIQHHFDIVKADVKSTLCHDQTPAIGIHLCVFRMVCSRMNL